MSFGFSLTDFKEVINLSWGLYESLKECPQEIKDLGRDFATVYGVLNHIEDDLEAKESAIRAHGEGRLKMLQTMILGLKGTIVEAQNIVDKFRPVAAESKKPEQLWLKLKWTVGQKKVNRIRQDISFHISSFTLLMTSMGNSSLQRIETGLEEMRITSAASEDYTAISASNEEECDGPSDIEEDSDVSSESEISTARNLSAPLQQAPEKQNTEAATVGRAPNAESPSWLKPIVMMPSLDFEANVQKIDLSMHAEFAEIIFSNCRVACFDFYHAHGLWRTKYGRGDITEPKLFQLDQGGFPKSAGDLSLRDWLVKIQRASARINETDTIHASYLYDFMGLQDTFSGMTRIHLLIDPWGRLDIDSVEECLLLSLRICRHINGWDSFGRLKVLWKELHRPSVDVGEAGLKLDFERLKPPPEKLRPTAAIVSSQNTS